MQDSNITNKRLNAILIHILQVLGKIENNSKRYFEINRNSVELLINKEKFLQITSAEMILSKNIYIREKLIHNTSSSKIDFDEEKIIAFIHSLSKNIERLNHLGISYFCSDVEKEIKFYKEKLTSTNFRLYEENSQSAERWFFIGDLEEWENPLFEVVLNKAKYNPDIWVPHFQIDLDTNLTYEELQIITNKYFGGNFFKWHLDIPNYGIVLGMGILGSIGGVKLALGLGTRLRNTQFHRKELLHEIK